MNVENEEFKALFDSSTWSPAEAARRLDVERSSISRFLSGQIKPSAPVLKLFKLILASEQPGALSAARVLREESFAEWEVKLIELLRPLHVEDRDRVIRTVQAMIDGLPKRPAVSYRQKSGVSSTQLSDAQVLAEKAGESKPSKR